MLGGNERADELYILDNNTISEIFRSYYQEQFPAFWERFDELVRAENAVSVRRCAWNRKTQAVLKSSPLLGICWT